MLCTLPPSSRVRALIDANSFFASCEILRHPSWEGKAVCVAREQDIVLAASYEAKSFGVTTGTATWEARRILPDAIFTPPDFQWYQHISHRLMRWLGEYGLQCIPFSVDEAFVELTRYDIRKGMTFEDLAEELIIMIKKHIGIPISIGIAPTKLLAKIFANVYKPMGSCVALEHGQIDILLQGLPLRAITFVGAQWSQHLRYRCQTALDFKQLSYHFVKKTMGGHGLKLWWELHGCEAMSFVARTHQLSVGRSRSFHPHFTSDEKQVWQYLQENVARAYRHMLSQHVCCKLVSVGLVTKDFASYRQDHHFASHTNEIILIQQQVRKLFDRLYAPGVLYRKTAIYFSHLVSGVEQQSLFDVDGGVIRQSKLSETINHLHESFGGSVVSVGM